MVFEEINFIKYKFFDNSFNVGFGYADPDDIVVQKRASIANYFGVSYDHLIMPTQIHTNIAVFVNKKIEIEADALITNTKGLLIGVQTADCVPILVCDLKLQYIAAIHAGWRGAVSGIVENTINKMIDFGCNDLYCKIGPCIHQESYTVQDDVIKKVQCKYIFERKFDLLQYVYDKLINLGVKIVSISPINTFLSNEYFSYRRDGRIGTQFSGIMIK